MIGRGLLGGSRIKTVGLINSARAARPWYPMQTVISDQWEGLAGQFLQFSNDIQSFALTAIYVDVLTALKVRKPGDVVRVGSR
jgi:hypothetical protein